MRNELSASAARHIIERMGETGQPPELHALAVNAGTEQLLQLLREEILLPIRDAGRNSSFKLVQAPFGGGKSHFLQCLRETAWELGLATALVGISPRECPFDENRTIYRAVAHRLELAPEGEGDPPEPGIDSVLERLAIARADRAGTAAARAALRDGLAAAAVECRGLRRAVGAYADAVLSDDAVRIELLGAYLRGEPAPEAELAPLGVRERLEEHNAYRFLRSLLQTLRALGVPGVVLLFDELDRVLSLTARRKRAIGDNLRQMIDHCGQAVLPGLLWVYAVPPEFLRTVVPEYPALEQRLRGAARFSDINPLAPVIDLDRLPVASAELFEAIGCRLLPLYELAYGCALDHSMQEENLRELAREIGQFQLESGTRRTFVKLAVALLLDQHRGGERRLEHAEIDRLVSPVEGADPAFTDEEEVIA